MITDFDQTRAILKIFKDEEDETTLSGKFNKLLDAIEIVIHELNETKEGKSAALALVFDNVVHVLSVMKHTHVLSLRHKTTTKELRSFVIAARNLMFMEAEKIEEGLNQLMNYVVPSFPRASDMRLSISQTIRQYKAAYVK